MVKIKEPKEGTIRMSEAKSVVNHVSTVGYNTVCREQEVGKSVSMRAEPVSSVTPRNSQP